MAMLDLEKVKTLSTKPIRAISTSIRTSIDEAPTEVRKAGKYVLLVALLIVASIAASKFAMNYWEQRALLAEQQAGPRVRVVNVGKSLGDRTISVLGEARPYAEVTLYAKVSGYLRDVKVDKGDVVRKDQVLARIESPETDKDYQGAFADAKNKRAIANRMNALRARSLVSQQEAEQADSDAEVSEARLAALAVQKGYETLRAPFDGKVTSRFADPGALVQNATASQTSALPVVTVSQVDRLRVYAYLDQKDAPFVTAGSPVTVTLRERPGFQVPGTIARVSGELDPQTRTLLTEVDLDNKKGDFVPGSFVEVSLPIHAPSLPQIPVEGLIAQPGKSLVAVVSQDNTVHFREVHPANNDGQFVTILSGLNEGEIVALNLGTNVNDGAKVRPILPEAKK
jgi:RND family efflux transporter MFP subunit